MGSIANKEQQPMSIYPYTYLIKHNPTNTFYYGVRWKNVRLGVSEIGRAHV